MSRPSAGMTRKTSPVRPLSRPLITTTLSPFLIFNFGIVRSYSLSARLRGEREDGHAKSASLEDLGGERDDLHEPPSPQFARHRAEDAGADRLALIRDQHRGVAVEADRTAIGAAYLLRRPHDDSAVDIALFDPAARDRFLHRNNDHVADRRGLALRAAQHLDALHPARAGIVRHVEVCLHLDHAAPSTGSAVRSSFVGVASARSSAAAAAAGFRAAARRPGAASGGPPITTQHFRLE